MRCRLMSALTVALTAALVVLGLAPASGQGAVPRAAAEIEGQANNRQACDARGDLKTGNDCVSHRTKGALGT